MEVDAWPLEVETPLTIVLARAADRAAEDISRKEDFMIDEK